MSSGLVKFMNEVNGNGRGALHWHRSDIDGAPFRGQIPPTMTTEEFEQKLTRVGDAKNRVFDLSDANDNQAYLKVLDKIVNGWAQPLHVERLITIDKKEVYIEWVEWFMEDGTPSAAQQPTMSMNHGR